MAGNGSPTGGASAALSGPPALAMTASNWMCPAHLKWVSPAQNRQLASMHSATREQKLLVRELGRRAGTIESGRLQEGLCTKVFFGSARDYERQIQWQFECYKPDPLALAGVLTNLLPTDTRTVENTHQVQYHCCAASLTSIEFLSLLIDLIL